MASVFPKFDIPGVWRGERQVAAVPVSTTGYRLLDQALLGGWPLGSLIQVSGSDEGLGFSLIVDSLAQITRAGRYVALVHTPLLPCAPALGSRGVNLEHLLWVQPDNQAGALWAMEQMTRSGLFAAVAYWGSPLDSTAERRLQLAADAGQCLAFCFRVQTTVSLPIVAKLTDRKTPLKLTIAAISVDQRHQVADQRHQLTDHERQLVDQRRQPVGHHRQLTDRRPISAYASIRP